MSLQFNLKDLIGTDYDGADLTDRIVDCAGRHIAADLSSEVKAVVRATAAEMTKAKIRDAIDNIFDTPFMETDNYGTIRKDAIARTPLEIIIGHAKQYMSDRVSVSGNPVGYGDKGISRLEWLAGKHAEELLKASIASEMRQAADEFKRNIGGKLSAAFSDALKNALK